MSRRQQAPQDQSEFVERPESAQLLGNLLDEALKCARCILHSTPDGLAGYSFPEASLSFLHLSQKVVQSDAPGSDILGRGFRCQPAVTIEGKLRLPFHDVFGEGAGYCPQALPLDDIRGSRSTGYFGHGAFG
ncbi:hypothetical protein LJR016_004239 [Devosia sp. LjRoot16]|uniref:hypothetical protein n=1 Tax=Devosia sp. LjRoot16 TaxID=3342271 RepID=UPI003ECDD316